MKLPSEKSKPVVNINDYIYLIHGDPKTGKTTFVSGFEKTLFIATEPGHKFQEIFKLEPKDWEDVRNIVKNLIKEEHDFKTIAIDTVDNAYKMCEQYVCKKNGISHPSDMPYGKGFSGVKEEFSNVISALFRHGMGIVFISHSQQKDVEEGSVKRTVTETTLSGSAAKTIYGLCDFIFHVYVDGEGKRWMKTKGSPYLKAGDRSGILPETMELDYKEFVKEINKWKPNKQQKETK